MSKPLTEKISHVLYRKRLKTARQRKRAMKKLDGPDKADKKN